MKTSSIRTASWPLPLLALAVAPACYDAGTVRQVSFAVEVAGTNTSTAPLQLETPSGWSVRLDVALLSIGPVYLKNVRPNAGGADDSGRVVAQVLDRFTIDALDATPRPLEVGGEGTTEPALSAEVRLAEAEDGPIADTFGPRSTIARVAGLATRGAERVPFDGTFVVPVTANTQAYKLFRDHIVAGVPVDLIVEQDGVLRIGVDASRWFDNVVFDRLTPGGEATRDFRDPSELGQLRAGLASRNTFSFTFTPAGDAAPASEE